MRFLNHRIGWSFLKWCGKLVSGTLTGRGASASKLTITRIRGTRGTSCERRNSMRCFSLAVTHSLGRHARTQPKTRGNSFDQRLKPQQIALRPLLWKVCCDAHASKQTTRLPTTTRLASVCVDLNSQSKARVEGAHRGVFWVTRSCALIQHIHTHTQTYKSPEVSQCLWVLRKSDTLQTRVNTIGKMNHHAQRVEVMQLKFFE